MKSELKEMVDVINSVIKSAIKTDRVQNTKLADDLLILLSEKETDYTTASAKIIQLIIKFGKFDKVPHILLEQIMDDGALLNKLRTELKVVKKFQHFEIIQKDPGLLRKEYKKIKDNWNKNVVLALRASRAGSSDSASYIAALQQIALSDQIEDKEHKFNGGFSLLDIQQSQ